LLENLRFHPGEENPEKEPAFASSLAELGNVYINDAFGTAHRAHASTATIAKFFPGKAAAGFLIEKEVAFLGEALLHPQHPFCAILGGAKISTKFKVIEVLMQKADVLLIGGAMAYTFFKAEDIPVGDSLVENEFLGVARELMDVSKQSRGTLLLPVDLVVAREINPQAEKRVIQIKDGIPEGFQGVDIGPETIQRYSQEIKKAATIFWNGPLGVFECPPFDQGTNAIAKTLANLVSATTIVGGGDSAAAIEHVGVVDRISHISTGGGAALEYIELGQLPGIEALSNKAESDTTMAQKANTRNTQNK
jgi:3-phosphoglycerate kinase